MENQSITTEQAEKTYIKVITDSTRWDLMTGKELEKRIAAFRGEKQSYDKCLELISCLRLAEIIYLRKQEGKRWTMPVIEHPEGSTILVFTAKKHMKNDAYKPYKTAKTTLPELLKAFEPCELLTVLINADTESLTLPVDLLNKMFDAFDSIEGMVDTKMQEGIHADDLEEIVFERFAGHRLECKTVDGETICGSAFRYGDDEEYGVYHDIDIGNNETVRLYKYQVDTIRDTTLLEE